MTGLNSIEFGLEWEVRHKHSHEWLIPQQLVRLTLQNMAD